MKNSKRFKDFEGWNKVKYIRSTEELVKLITQLTWGMFWEGIIVTFSDVAKEDLVFFSTGPRHQDFFETLGEISPEEIEFINFYSKDCGFELENLGPVWEYWVCGDTFEEELYRRKNQLSEEDN